MLTKSSFSYSKRLLLGRLILTLFGAGMICLGLSVSASAATIVGDNSNNTLNGTAYSDSIYGKGGNDWINGKDNGDYMYGDAGNDSLFGGAGGDWMYGGEGDDGWQCVTDLGYLNGTPPSCSMEGGYGVDVINGGPGTDFIVGQQDTDYLHGDDDGYQDFIYSYGDGVYDFVYSNWDYCYVDSYDVIIGYCDIEMVIG
jgi:Ca2+-binding RTX toxin-like protein